jgi:hypothetical protein
MVVTARILVRSAREHEYFMLMEEKLNIYIENFGLNTLLGGLLEFFNLRKQIDNLIIDGS